MRPHYRACHCKPRANDFLHINQLVTKFGWDPAPGNSGRRRQFLPSGTDQTEVLGRRARFRARVTMGRTREAALDANSIYGGAGERRDTNARRRLSVRPVAPRVPGALLSVVPDTQVLFGTDYPHLQPAITVEPMNRLGLRNARFKAIARDNALRLFPRLQA